MKANLRRPSEQNYGSIGLLFAAAFALLMFGIWNVFGGPNIPLLGGAWWITDLGLWAALIAMFRDDRLSAWGWRAIGLIALGLGFALLDNGSWGRSLIAGGLGAQVVAVVLDYRSYHRRTTDRWQLSLAILLVLCFMLIAAIGDGQWTVSILGMLLIVYYLMPGIRRMKRAIMLSAGSLFQTAERNKQEESADFGPMAPLEPVIDEDPMSDPIAQQLCDIIAAQGIKGWEDDPTDPSRRPRVMRKFTGPVFNTYLLNTPMTVQASVIERLAGIMGRVIGHPVMVLETPEYGVMIQVNKSGDDIGMVYYSDVAERYAHLVQGSEAQYAFINGVDGFNQPVVIDMMREQDPHTLFAGGTGSGKSMWLFNLLVQLMRKNSPADLQIAIADPKFVTGSQFVRVPHLWRPIADEPDQILELINSVEEEMNNRYKKLSATNWTKARIYNTKVRPEQRIPVLMLIIDEIADLTTHEDKATRSQFVNALGAIARKGRAANVMLVVGVQSPTAENLGGGTIRGQLTRRIALKMKAPSHSGMILGEGDDRAVFLTGWGDGILVEEGVEDRRFKGIYIPEDTDPKRPSETTLQQHIAEIIAQWGETKFEDRHSPLAQHTAAQVAAEHTAGVSDLQWLILKGLHGLATKEPQTRLWRLSRDQVMTATESVTPDGYVFAPALTPEAVEKVLSDWGFSAHRESGAWIIIPDQVSEMHELADAGNAGGYTAALAGGGNGRSGNSSRRGGISDLEAMARRSPDVTSTKRRPR